MKDDPTLNEVLSALGYSTLPRAFQGKKIMRRGKLIVEGDAGGVWDWLRTSGQIPEAFTGRVCGEAVR